MTAIKTCRMCSATSDVVEFYPAPTKLCKECCKADARARLVRRRERYGRLHSVWTQMRYRAKHHPDYAGRGILVCQEWDVFSVFYEWAIANGYQQGLEIDRRDNDGNYDPENCRWVTRVINGRNRRSVKLNEVTAGQIKTRLAAGDSRSSIASEFGVSQATVGGIAQGRAWVDVPHSPALAATG